MTSPDYIALTMILMGGAIATAASLWWLFATFSTSVLWGLGCMFIPFVSIIFFILHFKKAKGPVLTMFLAFGLFIGGVYQAREAQGYTWMFLTEALEARTGIPAEDFNRITQEWRKMFESKWRESELRKSKQARLNQNEDLLKAVRQGDAEQVKKLIQEGADPNLKTLAGTSALMEAAAFGYDNVVQILLQYGADPSTVNADGKTALDLAEENGRTEIAEILSYYEF